MNIVISDMNGKELIKFNNVSQTNIIGILKELEHVEYGHYEEIQYVIVGPPMTKALLDVIAFVKKDIHRFSMHDWCNYLHGDKREFIKGYDNIEHYTFCIAGIAMLLDSNVKTIYYTFHDKLDEDILSYIFKKLGLDADAFYYEDWCNNLKSLYAVMCKSKDDKSIDTFFNALHDEYGL